MPDPFEIFDALSEIVYVSDLETHDLYYVNAPGSGLIAGPWQGRKCYEALQGKDSPCEFCTNHLLSDSEFYTWTHYNQGFESYFQLKDKIINWNGRRSRFEVAFDVTESERQKAMLENQLGLEKLLVDCIIDLQQSNGLTGDLSSALGKIGSFLGGDRVYIFQVELGVFMNNTHEWCAEGVNPERENLQGIEIDFIDRWLPFFKCRDCVVITDLEALKEVSPDEHAILAPQHIKSLVVAPLVVGSELMGYLGIDNPSTDYLEEIASFFKPLAVFLSMEIEKNIATEMLARMGLEDSLTGVRNRNSFIKDVEDYDAEGPRSGFGVMYLDLNGLKDINDQFGHEEGDRVLVRTAEVLSDVFLLSRIYRLGGDEFLVVSPVIERSVFENRVQAARMKLDEQLCPTAAGVYYADEPCLVNDAVKSADSRMYDDKRMFYCGRLEESRHSSLLAN